jgi:hypothetical protein
VSGMRNVVVGDDGVVEASVEKQVKANGTNVGFGGGDLVRDAGCRADAAAAHPTIGGRVRSLA